ncbi:hypothetical protein PR048_009404 [Dryococelus australis]|uniref:Ribosomal protein L23 n=1 Tax=Dryococelus australis TaxID=614101 RepID=A0ABQ9I0Q7_9NEOP|nr:hypothetical protein PR048_009404 [Dryococelus australis]
MTSNLKSFHILDNWLYISDGGHLLNSVKWQRLATYEEIMNRYIYLILTTGATTAIPNSQLQNLVNSKEEQQEDAAYNSIAR